MLLYLSLEDYQEDIRKSNAGEGKKDEEKEKEKNKEVNSGDTAVWVGVG